MQYGYAIWCKSRLLVIDKFHSKESVIFGNIETRSNTKMWKKIKSDNK